MSNFKTDLVISLSLAENPSCIILLIFRFFKTQLSVEHPLSHLTLPRSTPIYQAQP